MSGQVADNLSVIINYRASLETHLGIVLDNLLKWAALPGSFTEPQVNDVLIELTIDMLARVHASVELGPPLPTKSLMLAKTWGKAMFDRDADLRQLLLSNGRDVSRLKLMFQTMYEVAPLMKSGSFVPPPPPSASQRSSTSAFGHPGSSRPNGQPVPSQLSTQAAPGWDHVGSTEFPLPSRSEFLPVGGWTPAVTASARSSGYPLGAQPGLVDRPIVAQASGPAAQPSVVPISKAIRRDAPHSSSPQPSAPKAHGRQVSAQSGIPSTPRSVSRSVSNQSRPVVPVSRAGPSSPATVYQRRWSSKSLQSSLDSSTSTPVQSTPLPPPARPSTSLPHSVRPVAAASRRPSKPQPLPTPTIDALRYLRLDRLVGQIMLSRYFDGTDTDKEERFRALMAVLDKMESTEPAGEQQVAHPSGSPPRSGTAAVESNMASDQQPRPPSATPAATNLPISADSSLAGSGSFCRTIHSDQPEPILTPSATPSPRDDSLPPRPTEVENAAVSGSSPPVARYIGPKRTLKLKFRRPTPVVPAVRPRSASEPDPNDTGLEQSSSRKKRRTSSQTSTSLTDAAVESEESAPSELALLRDTDPMLLEDRCRLLSALSIGRESLPSSRSRSPAPRIQSRSTAPSQARAISQPVEPRGDAAGPARSPSPTQAASPSQGGPDSAAEPEASAVSSAVAQEELIMLDIAQSDVSSTQPTSQPQPEAAVVSLSRQRSPSPVLVTEMSLAPKQQPGQSVDSAETGADPVIAVVLDASRPGAPVGEVALAAPDKPVETEPEADPNEEPISIKVDEPVPPHPAVQLPTRDSPPPDPRSPSPSAGQDLATRPGDQDVSVVVRPEADSVDVSTLITEEPEPSLLIMQAPPSTGSEDDTVPSFAKPPHLAPTSHSPSSLSSSIQAVSEVLGPPRTETEEEDESMDIDDDSASHRSQTPPPVRPAPSHLQPEEPATRAPFIPPPKAYQIPPRSFMSSGFVPLDASLLQSGAGAEASQERIDALFGKWGVEAGEDLVGPVDLGWVWEK